MMCQYFVNLWVSGPSVLFSFHQTGVPELNQQNQLETELGGSEKRERDAAITVHILGHCPLMGNAVTCAFEPRKVQANAFRV